MGFGMFFCFCQRGICNFRETLLFVIKTKKMRDITNEERFRLSPGTLKKVNEQMIRDGVDFSRRVGRKGFLEVRAKIAGKKRILEFSIEEINKAFAKAMEEAYGA
jgi:hypothetical protein